MKLHLPKLLRVAVIAAVCCPTVSYAENNTTYPKVSDDGKLINVGLASKGNSSSNVVKWTEDDLDVGEGMKVGYFDDAWNFKQTHNVINGNPTSEALLNKSISNSLQVNGKLTITGNGMVYLGGQVGANYYTGLIATNVIVGIAADEDNNIEENKATGTVQYGGVTTSGNTYNLSASLANIDNLTINSGAVVFRPNGGTANFKQGDAMPTSKAKISWIKDKLTVTGGVLYMGHTQGAAPSGYTQHFLNGFGRSSSDAATISQSDGYVYIYGRTYIYAGLNLTQSGGDMCIAMGEGKNVNSSSLLVFSGSSKNVINQEKGTLTLGKIGADNWSKNYNGNVLLEINQTGNGVLNLAGGTLYTSEIGKESSITQSGGGTINLGGDFTSAVFDIDQTKGTIKLQGGAKFAANKADIGDTLQLDDAAVLKATKLNLSKNANFVNSGIIVAGTDATNATKGWLNVAAGGKLNLRDDYGSAEGAIKQVAMRGGEMTYAGTVALESIDMSGGALNLVETDNTFSVGSLSATGGALTMSDKSDSVSVGDFNLGQGGYANYLVTGSSATSTPLTIGSSFTVAEGAVFELSFTDTYLSTEAEGNTISFTINVAELTGVADDKISFATDSVVTDCVTWILSDVSWDVNDNIGQLSGTLTKITEGDITIDEEIEINNAVDGDLKLVIKEDTTISADNTHTGGTEIIGAEVTLNSETPLGDGSVTTSGESSIIGAYDADDGSLAILPDVVQNSEKLTIEGAFDGTELTEETKTGSYICVDGELGNNGFAVQDGKLIQVVENTTDEASLTIGADGATLTKDGVSYDIHECGYAANLDYTGYRIAEDTHEVTVKEIIAAGGTSNTEITMEAGKLTVDGNVNNLQASGGTVVIANYNVKGQLTGDTKVEVTKGTANWLYGDNDYSGGTTITDARLRLGDVNALGTGAVKTVGTSELWSTSAIAKLSTTIENNGKLQMRGKFDGSLLGTQELETGDIYVSTTGELGANGFFRQGEALVVVNNASGATLLNTYGKEIVEVYKADKAYVLGSDGLAVHTDWNTYYINEADADGTDHEVAMSVITDASGSEDTAVEMKTGVLIADADVKNLKATGGTVKAQGAAITGELSGTTSVSVESGDNTLTGDNTYTGDTKIEASKLTVGSESALGASTVYLVNGAALDLNHLAVGNNIVVSGCSLCNADAFTGNVDVLDGADLEMDGAASVNKVTLHGSGSISSPQSDSLTVNAIEMASAATGSISAPVFTNEGGVITLNDGNLLNVTGTLTLGQGTTFVLNGGGYQTGSVLAKAADGVNDTTGQVKLAYGYGAYVASGDVVTLVGIFDQTKADMAAQANWGIATASRAFVNTVRGQHSHTGCIGNGRGTVWAAVLGAYNDMDGADISVQGAAVGVDTQVGARSTVGIAAGYTDGEVSPAGLRDVDQEGNYVALYGEHGLKKLNGNSCLSLDWVAAYGQTESKAAGLKWEQDSLQLNTRLNWNKKVSDRLCMSVFGGLEYFASGSDTSQGVKSGSIQNLRGEVGVGARYVAWGAPSVTDGKGGLVRPGCEKLVFNGELRYFNDMVRSNPVIEMDGLRGDGENPGRQGVGIEAGTTYRIGERWSASANYSFNAMEDSTEHRVNVGASYTF